MSPAASSPPTAPHRGSGKHGFSPTGTSLSSPLEVLVLTCINVLSEAL